MRNYQKKYHSMVLRGMSLSITILLSIKTDDKEEKRGNNRDTKDKQCFGGRHVLIYQNKDRLGPGVQLIVAPFYNHDYHDDDHDDHQFIVMMMTMMIINSS